MTFLLQKFNAINRTRAEVRTRNRLRSSASGIAFTGRFAACLLMASFLGVGSAMAQDHILRIGDRSITVDPNSQRVHHYQIGGADAVQDPTTGGLVNTFLVDPLALVTVQASGLLVTPIATGAFKITLDAAYTGDLTNAATTIEFAIMSANAPRLVGTASNTEVQSDMVTLELIPRDDASAEYDLLAWFSDPNDIYLTYDPQADSVGRGAADGSDGEDIVTATEIDNDLTIALTNKATIGDVTDVWVTATDGAGEYARKRIQVTVGTATRPYVMTELEDMQWRQNAISDLEVESLGAGFADDDLGTPARTLDLSIDISDQDATKVSGASTDEFVWVTDIMVATVDLRATEQTLSIRPLGSGSTSFTVTATDKGVPLYACPTGHTTIDDPVTETSSCVNDADPSITVNPGDPTYPNSQSVSDSFEVRIISRTTPTLAEDILPDGATLVSDVDSIITVDLEDLNGDDAGEPAAFGDPAGKGLTYSATAKDDDIIEVSVDGSVITIEPIWRMDDKSTMVTVTAENSDEETNSQDFEVTVKSATMLIVNPDAQPILDAGIVLKTGDDPTTWKLINLTNAEGVKDYVPLFIDPNASASDALPGGLLLKMPLANVVADHRYDNLSTDNDVYTSAMRIMLDPYKATLTVIPVGANSAEVTIWATDRERNEESATVMITVVSCDGVDMSAPCEGVITGTEDEELPKEVELSQNYPNPFNPQTTIDYALPQAGDVSLIVYDMLGREVDVLLDGPQVAGRHTVRFGANHLPNGAYVYRLVAADKTITRTMVLVK